MSRTKQLKKQALSSPLSPDDIKSRRQLWSSIFSANFPHFEEVSLEKMSLECRVSANNVRARTPAEFTSLELSSDMAQILSVIYHLRPDIYYCPILPHLCAVLLTVLDKQATFSWLYAIVTDATRWNIPVSRVQNGIFVRCLTVTCVKFARLPRNQEQIVLPQFSNWHLWIFSYLQPQFSLLVTDCFLAQGSKVLFRTVTRLVKTTLKHSHPDLSHLDTGVRDTAAALSSRYTPVEFGKAMHTFRNFSGTKLNKIKGQVAVLSDPDNFLPQQAKDFTTVLRQTHEIDCLLNAEELDTLISWLPARHQLLKPQLVFTTTEHGFSLGTLYMKSEEMEDAVSVLLVETTLGEKCGAFLASTLQSSSPDGFYGTGESFVFTFASDKTGAAFRWNETHNSAFIRSSAGCIEVGGGNSGTAIRLEKNLETVHSQHCDTFGSSPLVTGTTLRTLQLVSFVSH